MIMLSMDIYEMVFNNCDFISQIRLRQLSCLTYCVLQMTDFYNINGRIKSLLDDTIIAQYAHIRQLDASLGCIHDVNNLTELRKLNTQSSQINQKGIDKLKYVRILFADRHNARITNVNHLQDLRILYATHQSGIDQAGIADLRKLIILYARSNSKITSVNHLTELRKLFADNTCGIDQTGILKLCKLETLTVQDNPRIVCVNHLTELLALRANYGSGIDQTGIASLRKLVDLYAVGNNKITDIRHLSQLAMFNGAIINVTNKIKYNNYMLVRLF